MNKNEKLIESITGFFIPMGKRDGHRCDYILSLLREIRFTALYHAICENACPVHAFAAISDVSGKLNYRSNPLFPGNGAILPQKTISLSFRQSSLLFLPPGANRPPRRHFLCSSSQFYLTIGKGWHIVFLRLCAFEKPPSAAAGR